MRHVELYACILAFNSHIIDAGSMTLQPLPDRLCDGLLACMTAVLIYLLQGLHWDSSSRPSHDWGVTHKLAVGIRSVAARAKDATCRGTWQAQPSAQ